MNEKCEQMYLHLWYNESSSGRELHSCKCLDFKKNPENDEDQGRSDENTKNITENQYNITWFFEVRQDTEKLLAIPTKNEKESSSQKLEITALLSWFCSRWLFFSGTHKALGSIPSTARSSWVSRNDNVNYNNVCSLKSLLCFYKNLGLLLFSSVKNVIGILMQIASNL